MFADRRTVKQKRLTEVAILHETNPGSEIETGFLRIEWLTKIKLMKLQNRKYLISYCMFLLVLTSH